MTLVGWANRRGRAMGSWAELLVWGPDPEPLADWAMAEIERYEECWSRFRRTSELVALNARAGGSAVSVSPRLWDALTVARRAARDTGELFDPTVLGSLLALGYDRSFPFTPRAAAGCAAVRAAPGFAMVELDDARRTVRLPAGCGVDLGGIGKGLAADRVVDGLLARGAISACLSMGGDVRVAGPGPDADDAWGISVEDPRDDRSAFVFPLVDEALAQSSVLHRRWTHGGRDVHHLVDPRTGDAAASGVICAIVTAREAWRAEALAKAALVAGVEGGLALLEGVGVDGWLLDIEGTPHATRDVADVKWDDLRSPRRATEVTTCSRP